MFCKGTPNILQFESAAVPDPERNEMWLTTEYLNGGTLTSVCQCSWNSASDDFRPFPITCFPNPRLLLLFLKYFLACSSSMQTSWPTEISKARILWSHLVGKSNLVCYSLDLFSSSVAKHVFAGSFQVFPSVSQRLSVTSKHSKVLLSKLYSWFWVMFGYFPRRSCPHGRISVLDATRND